MTILHIEFPNQYELASTFLRFQEHYESTEFKNKIFTHEEYFNWYAKTYGNMTYFSDWSGFNLPDYTFDKFFQCEFDPLWRKEKKLLNKLEYYRFNKIPYYVIGTCKDKNDALAHEIIHGLYYTREQYKIEVNVTQAAFRTEDLTKISNAFYKKSYASNVHRDELNAYALTDWAKFLPGVFSIKKNFIIDSLHETFKNYFGFDLRKKPELLSHYVTTLEWNN